MFAVANKGAKHAVCETGSTWGEEPTNRACQGAGGRYKPPTTHLYRMFQSGGDMLDVKIAAVVKIAIKCQFQPAHFLQHVTAAPPDRPPCAAGRDPDPAPPLPGADPKRTVLE